MDASRNTFVLSGRESHYERLRAGLALALDGAPQILLLSGTAGSGKTTLIREFCRRTQQTEPELLVVYAQCSSQSGAGRRFIDDLLDAEPNRLDGGNHFLNGCASIGPSSAPFRFDPAALLRHFIALS